MKRSSVIAIVVVVVVVVIAALVIPVWKREKFSSREQAYSKTFVYQDKASAACLTVIAEGSLVADLATSKSLLGTSLNRVTDIKAFNIHTSLTVRNLRNGVCVPALNLKQARFAQTISGYSCSQPQSGPLTSPTHCDGYAYDSSTAQDVNKEAGVQFDGPGTKDAYASGNIYPVAQSGWAINSWPKTCVDIGAWAQYQLARGGQATEAGFTWSTQQKLTQQVCIQIP